MRLAHLAALVLPTLARRSIHEHVTQNIIQPTSSAAASTVEQPLDHFNAQEGRRWKMRYWVDNSSWDGAADSPVFLSMGGEGASGPPGGQMAELAEKYHGLLASIEHRYFGESIPTKDFATANLQWLGTEQALADAAYFQRFLSEKLKLKSSNKWVTFGGSYSGELAAWARLKYPALFHAAVASSSPVTASIDYWGYDPIVAQALTRTDLGGSQGCFNSAKTAFAAFEKMMEDNSKGGARSKLQSTFHTCGPVVTDGDCFLLHDYVSDDFMGLVQYNNANGLRNINSTCAVMTNATIGTPFERLLHVTLGRLTHGASQNSVHDGASQNSVHDGKGHEQVNSKTMVDGSTSHEKPCLFDPDPSGESSSISFEAHLAGYANASNGGRSFPYMQCADGCGHDQTCYPDKGCIFSPKYASIDFFQQMCKTAFDISADQ
jgi:pimeloyl-ACP methyl ester carboxylesterase